MCLCMAAESLKTVLCSFWPTSPEAMVQAVRRVLTEPGLAERLSLNSHRKVEPFDWPAVLEQWKDLFKDVNQNA